VAKAKKRETVTYTVELDLSLEEAQVIFDITEKIAGSPETSRRKFVDSIRSSLFSIVGATKDTTDLEVTPTGMRFKNRS
jgi:hypothetical protein